MTKLGIDGTARIGASLTRDGSLAAPPRIADRPAHFEPARDDWQTLR